MLYKVLILLNDKGKWFIFLFCLNREGYNRSKSEDDKFIVFDYDFMYDRNGLRFLILIRYVKFKMYRWLYKRKLKLFFYEIGFDLIILLKFLFLWNIWLFYKIICFCELWYWFLIFTIEVRVELDLRILIRGYWREFRLVSFFFLFC